MKTSLKNKIIKFLGGYTIKEFNRVERKYQALLDSKTDNNCAKITNEYIYRNIRILDDFAKNELYGHAPDEWCIRMYNVIHNNMLRILIRYLHMESCGIYNIDTTLDTHNGFKHILENDKDENALNFLNEHN